MKHLPISMRHQLNLSDFASDINVESYNFSKCVVIYIYSMVVFYSGVRSGGDKPQHTYTLTI